MKALYRKVFTDKRNPGCKGVYYKKMNCKSRNRIDSYLQDF